MFNRELGQAEVFNEDQFLDKLKEEVVEKFSTNFLQLQIELDSLKRQTKLDTVERLL